MNTQDTLSLHTGRATLTLQPGQTHIVRARAGERYRVVKRKGETEQLVDNVIARRVGDDLQLSYLDGTQVTLQNYYEECKALVACEVALPASTEESYRPGAETAQGATLSDGSQLVYAHGTPDALSRMAGEDTALRSAIADLRGELITYIPTDARSPLAYGLFPAALLFIREATHSPKDTEAPALPSSTPSVTDDVGSVTGALANRGVTDDARPTFAGIGAEAGATVTLVEGGTVLGTSVVAADGTWRITPLINLSEGVHRVSYRLTDTANNSSALSAPLEFSVDTTAPSALGVALDPADDGVSTNGVVDFH